MNCFYAFMGFTYTQNHSHVLGSVYSEIYGGVCHPIFEATPRSMHESLENTLKSKNEYYT